MERCIECDDYVNDYDWDDDDDDDELNVYFKLQMIHDLYSIHALYLDWGWLDGGAVLCGLMHFRLQSGTDKNLFVVVSNWYVRTSDRYL